MSWLKDELSASLQFKKSVQSDMYFFNSYTASLQKPDNAAPVSQTFYIGKDGHLYHAMVTLDFKQTTSGGNYKARQFSDSYGFELEKALAKYLIKELANQQDRSRLTDSLQKGNRQSVTFLEGGSEQKRFVEASPQFKSITVYDEHQQRIRQPQSEKQTESQNTAQQQAEKKGKGISI